MHAHADMQDAINMIMMLHIRMHWTTGVQISRQSSRDRGLLLETAARGGGRVVERVVEASDGGIQIADRLSHHHDHTREHTDLIEEVVLQQGGLVLALQILHGLLTRQHTHE